MNFEAMPSQEEKSEEKQEEEQGKREGEMTAAEILDSLSPEKVIDEEGIERNIYAFKDAKGQEVRAIFYGREELPFSRELVEGRSSFVLGAKPLLRKEGEWADFVEKIRVNSKNPLSSPTLFPSPETVNRPDNPTSFFVEKNPLAIIDFLTHLGVSSEELKEIYRGISRHEIDNQGDELIDRIIAAKVLDDEGNWRGEINDEAEALLVLALQGNERAKEVLDKKLSMLRKKDQEVQAAVDQEVTEQTNYIETNINPDIKPLDVKSLVAVHATGYRPIKSKEDFEVSSLFEGTNWRIPRSTIHFALNHQVAGHMYGNWDNQPYVLISPLEDLIKRNDKPVNLNTVDTYFEVSPGHQLKLPLKSSKVISPDSLPPGVLVGGRSSNEVTYRRGDFSPKEIEEFAKLAGGDIEKVVHPSSILSSFRYGVTDLNGEDYNPELSQLAVDLQSFLNKKFIFSETQDPESPKITAMLQDMPIPELVSSLVEDFKMPEKFDKEAIKESISRRIEGVIVAALKEFVVNKTLKEMGYEVKPGGNWSWGGEWDATNQAIVAARGMGVWSGPHSTDPRYQIERDLVSSSVSRGIFDGLENGDSSIKDFREYLSKDLEKDLPQMTPKSRRMVYLRGLI